MRRQSVILTAFFALFLATFAPIRAQESAATNENAGIMLAANNLAYTRISDLIRGQHDGYSLTSESSATNAAELYTYILKDVADDSTGDVWFFSGMLLAYGKRTSSSSSSTWLEFPLTATLYRLSNGAWALCSSSVAFGLPNNMTSFSNTYGVTYDEGANYYEQLVAAARRSSELRGTTFNETSYYNYINYATWDTDNGGVNNLAEWVRGTAVDNWQDDAPSDSKCKCGACCSCECKCEQWSGAECDKTPDACDCHKPPCTCANYCCSHTCECEACKDKTEAEHGKHKNGYVTCNGGIDSLGCACHYTTEEKECECAKYCCKHTCKCEKCGDGEHSAHENGSATCDNTDGESGCSCHKTDDPENPDEEECECAKYCCLHTCACKKCGGGEHSAHGNGLPTCDGTTENTGCACHKTTGEEEECTCANYCCACKCECQKCKAAGSCSGAHKNGGTKCDGVSSGAPGGSTYECSCHTTTGEEEEEFDPPQQPDFEELTPEERKKFLSGSSESDPNSFSGALNRLRNALNDKFKIDVLASWLDPDFSGDLPRFDVPLPNEMGTIIIDFATFKTYSDMLMLRSVLAFGVFWYFISAVIRDVKKFL